MPTVESTEMIERIKKALADDVGPALDMDGTQIEVVGYDRGVAQLRLAEVCSSCPSSIMTVIMGIEAELRKRIPEVDYLEAVP